MNKFFVLLQPLPSPPQRGGSLSPLLWRGGRGEVLEKCKETIHNYLYIAIILTGGINRWFSFTHS